MHNEFTAIIERDGEWFIAQCPEVPEANGQGRTPDEAKSDLAAAIQLVLEDRREDALKAASANAVRDVITVGTGNARSCCSIAAAWRRAQTRRRKSFDLAQS